MVRWGKAVDHGIRSVIYLAGQEKGKKIPLGKIARELKISATFLAKIL